MIKVVTFKPRKLTDGPGIPLEAFVFETIEKAREQFPTVGVTDKDFCGPIKDGEYERYESWEAYNLLCR